MIMLSLLAYENFYSPCSLALYAECPGSVATRESSHRRWGQLATSSSSTWPSPTCCSPSRCPSPPWTPSPAPGPSASPPYPASRWWNGRAVQLPNSVCPNGEGWGDGGLWFLARKSSWKNSSGPNPWQSFPAKEIRLVGWPEITAVLYSHVWCAGISATWGKQGYQPLEVNRDISHLR